MRKDLTEIVVVLDNSGSMATKVADTVGGLKAFITAQREVPGEAKFTLIEFSSRDKYQVTYNGVPLSSVGDFNLRPSGNTALFDAIGKTIVDVGERLARTPEDQRPGLVVFAIITDGEENNSINYTRSKIKDMISHQNTQYNWQFTYLGANQDAFSVGNSMGINSSIRYGEQHTHGAIKAVSSNASRMRFQAASSQPISNSYTVDEINSIS